ncbi:unnamed protein product [Enterobius vermicularis]|uniref:Neur_chan_LBD domain-containing protein n=1 Tax=Enterobius vermicularis TaxID=51028 RepID=A0A0N4VPW2_ENTVE|nr:unnamed protein product [Enterobius vermicularis]
MTDYEETTSYMDSVADDYLSMKKENYDSSRTEYDGNRRNLRSLRDEEEIPLTYRLHDHLLQRYRKGTRPVAHPRNTIEVTMSVFLYQITGLVSFSNLSYYNIIDNIVVLKKSVNGVCN